MNEVCVDKHLKTRFWRRLAAAVASLVMLLSMKGCPMEIPIWEINRMVNEVGSSSRIMAKMPVNIMPTPAPYLKPFLSTMTPAGMVSRTCTRGNTRVNHITLLAGILSDFSMYVSMAAKFSQ